MDFICVLHDHSGTRDTYSSLCPRKATVSNQGVFTESLQASVLSQRHGYRSWSTSYQRQCLWHARAWTESRTSWNVMSSFFYCLFTSLYCLVGFLEYTNIYLSTIHETLVHWIHLFSSVGFVIRMIVRSPLFRQLYDNVQQSSSHFRLSCTWLSVIMFRVSVNPNLQNDGIKCAIPFTTPLNRMVTDGYIATRCRVFR